MLIDALEIATNDSVAQTGRMYSRRRSSSLVADAMEGVEYTGRSGKPRRLGSSEYDRLRREGRCFNWKRRGHVSTACSEDEESSKKTKKTVGVARAIPGPQMDCYNGPFNC
jgi:hypothetical protein